MSELSMNTNNANIGEENDIKPMNLLQRVLGIIVSPGETMRNLAVKPRIILPILIIALATLSMNLIRYPIYSETVKQAGINATEHVIEKMSDKLTDDQIKQMREKAAENSEKGMIQGLAAVPAVSLISWLFGTLILFLAAKIFKGQGKYKHYLSMTGYAYIITVLYTLINTIASFFTGNLKLDFSLALMSNMILQQGAGTFIYGFMYTILRSLDVFNIWHYIVIAIGVAEVSKLSKTKSYIIVSVVFILSVLIGAALAGAGEAFSGAISAQI